MANFIGLAKRSGFTDLSLSENPLGCSPKVFSVLKKSLSDIHKYPDPASSRLKNALSDKFAIAQDSIVVTNGSEALIDLIPRAFLNPGDEVILPVVNFPLIERMVILNRGRAVFSKMTSSFDIDIADIKKKVTKKTKIVFLCNPNNPTGKVLPRRQILALAKAISPILLVVDEANIEFGGDSVVKAVKRQQNIFVIKTFSKGFGLAGLRIGIGFGPKELIAAMDAIRQPFGLHALAEHAAIAALNDVDFIEKTRKHMNREREFLTKQLRKRGFEVVDSQANNLLVRVDKLFGTSTRFCELLSQKGVSVVNCNSFRGLGEKFIRVSPRKRFVNREFLRVVDTLLSLVQNSI